MIGKGSGDICSDYINSHLLRAKVRQHLKICLDTMTKPSAIIELQPFFSFGGGSKSSSKKCVVRTLKCGNELLLKFDAVRNQV